MSSREVRWIIQTSRPGHDDWYNTDETYTGWFYSDGRDKPTTSLMRDWDDAVRRYDWLDVRLWKDVRSYNVTSAYLGTVGVVAIVRRNGSEEEYRDVLCDRPVGSHSTKCIGNNH